MVDSKRRSGIRVAEPRRSQAFGTIGVIAIGFASFQSGYVLGVLKRLEPTVRIRTAAESALRTTENASHPYIVADLHAPLPRDRTLGAVTFPSVHDEQLLPVREGERALTTGARPPLGEISEVRREVSSWTAAPAGAVVPGSTPPSDDAQTFKKVHETERKNAQPANHDGAAPARVPYDGNDPAPASLPDLL